MIIQPEIPPAFYIVCRSFVPLPNKPQGIRLVFPKFSFCILFQTIVELAETGSLDLSIFCSTCLVNYTDTDTRILATVRQRFFAFYDPRRYGNPSGPNTALFATAASPSLTTTVPGWATALV